MNIWDTLKQKYYGIPLWLYVSAGILGLALYINHRNKTAKTSDETAADQMNTNLGSASEVPNEFWQAGTMPYQGGDVYVNTTSTPNPPATTPPVNSPTISTVTLAKGAKVEDLITLIRKNYDPGFTWDQFWKLNPNIKKSLKYNGKPGDYTATGNVAVKIR